MIKSNQHILNRIQVLIDAGIIIVSYVLAWYLRIESGIFTKTAGVLPMQVYMKALVFVVPGYLLLYYLFQLYTPRRFQSRLLEVKQILKANVIGSMGFVLILYMAKQIDFSRQVLVLFFIFNVSIEVISRYVLRLILREIRKKGYNQKHVLVVGSSRAADQYLERIRRNPQWGYQVFGILKDAKKLGDILDNHELDEVVITLDMKEYDKLEGIVDICEKAGVHTKFIPDYGNVIPTRPHIEDMQGMPVIHIRKVPLHEQKNRWIKRGMDVAGALLGLIIFSPIMLIAAIGIKVTTHGSIIYKQKRVGYQNKTFQMYKFRSMIEQDLESEKKQWSTTDDPRITAIGKVMRKTNVDELPQLVNVLKGEMSLVGPRPERPQFVEKFKQEIPRYMVKHQVRPGMTGWAQIHGYRGDTSIEKRIEHDLYYIENWTLGMDIKIIVQTFFKGYTE